MATPKIKHIQFRCSAFEKKLLKVKAERSGLSLSQFCRKSCLGKEVRERLSDNHIEVYKSLFIYHNNFKRIGNMFRKKDPQLAEYVYKLAGKIEHHLKYLRNDR